MALRTRETTIPPFNGRRREKRVHKSTGAIVYGSWEVPNTPSGQFRESHRCVDDIIVGDCGSLDISHSTVAMSPMSGTIFVNENSTYRWYVEYESCIPIPNTFTGVQAGLSEPSLVQPTDQQLVTKLLAKSNPNVPDFSFINFALEMREIPELVRSNGQRMIHSMAGANLKMHFGLTPFLNDINYLLDFQAAVDKQIALLEYANKRGYVRRTRSLWKGESSTFTQSKRYDGGNYRTVALCSVNAKLTRSISGHVRWFPTSKTPKTAGAIAAAARAQVFGLPTSSYGAMSVAWEALPWSWLVDWFFTTGQFLEANNNNLGLQAKIIRIMEKQELTYKLGYLKQESFGTAVPQFSDFYNSATAKRVTLKRRVPGTHTASLTSRIEFLNWTQFGILASLSVTKTGRFSQNSPGLAKLLRGPLTRKR